MSNQRLFAAIAAGTVAFLIIFASSLAPIAPLLAVSSNAVTLTNNAISLTSSAPATRNPKYVAPAAYKTVVPANAPIDSVLEYGADPTGQTDSTAAIQAAINNNQQSDESYHRAHRVFLPAGTYRISDTIVGRRWIHLVGESKATTKIVLSNNATGFGDVNTPKNVVQVGFSGNESYGVRISDLSIEVGTGNAGAIGLQYHGNNSSNCSRIGITMKSGFAALRIGGKTNVTHSPGPLIVEDLDLDGGKVGVFIDHFINEITAWNLNFKHQTEAVFQTTNAAYLHGGHISSVQSGDVKVFDDRGTWGAAVALIDSSFKTTDATVTAFNFKNTEGEKYGYYFDNVELAGYGNAIDYYGIKSGNGTGTLYDASKTSKPEHPDVVKTAFSSSATRLNLPIQEHPLYYNPVLSEWTEIPHAADGATLQQLLSNQSHRALYVGKRSDNQGRSIVNINTDLTIPPHIECIDFMGQDIQLHAGENAQRTVTVTGGDANSPPLVLRFASFDGAINLQHQSPRTVIIEHGYFFGSYTAAPGAGNLFVKDTTGLTKFTLTAGQNAWMRQANTARFNLPTWFAESTPIFNLSNANLWVIGIMTEHHHHPNFHLEAGSKVESIGFWFNAYEDKKPWWFFDIADSQLFVGGYLNQGNGGVNLLRETRDGVTQTYTPPDNESRITGSIVAHP
jgi:Pectate lyase superfamily protein